MNDQIVVVSYFLKKESGQQQVISDK